MLKKYPLPVILVIYLVGFVLLYPLYQYIFDVDGVGYLSVTRRLASGDYINGINGFWSPLHSWLALPLYKAGINEFAAFRIVSALAGAGILVVVNRLLNKTPIESTVRVTALFVCIPIILAYVFSELSADILLCVLLLVYTDIITEPDFFERPVKNTAAGVVACLAYLAKTVAFPFFLLHFIIVQFFLYKRAAQPGKKKALIKNLFAGIGSFLLLATPWIWILYNRYHIFTLGHVLIFGHSQQLNLAYYFTPGQSSFTDILSGPPAPLCSNTENPYYLLTNSSQSYGSLFTISFIAHQAKQMALNAIAALRVLHDFSFLAPAIVVLLGVYILQKKDRLFSLLVLVMGVLTSGYLLLHIEHRFLWPAFFLVFISGVFICYKLVHPFPLNKRLIVLCWCIFFGSFLITPLNTLTRLSGKGKDVFELAQDLQSKGVRGKFLSNNSDMAAKYAYLTGSTSYMLITYSYTYNELLAACHKHGIDYFFYHYNTPNELDAFKSTPFYKGAIQEINLKMPNLLLLKMK